MRDNCNWLNYNVPGIAYFSLLSNTQKGLCIDFDLIVLEYFKSIFYLLVKKSYNNYISYNYLWDGTTGADPIKLYFFTDEESLIVKWPSLTTKIRKRRKKVI